MLTEKSGHTLTYYHAIEAWGGHNICIPHLNGIYTCKHTHTHSISNLMVSSGTYSNKKKPDSESCQWSMLIESVMP